MLLFYVFADICPQMLPVWCQSDEDVFFIYMSVYTEYIVPHKHTWVH